MRTTTYVLAILAITFSCHNMMAQVGIGTTSPKSMLDIPASNPAAPANTDGILIPRIDTFPSTNPGSDQDGMMVFLTTTSGGDARGFYYWDNTATQWIAYNDEWKDGTNGSGDALIYARQANANGIDVIVLDNGRIGMGTDDPEESLELKLDGDNDIQISSANPSDSPQLIFYTNNGTWASPAYHTDNQHIGYVTAKVWRGSGKSGDVANIQLKADGNHSAGSLPTKIEFTVTEPNDTNVGEHDPEFVISSSGNVGIGLNGPSAVLEIKAGTSSANSAPLKINAGTNLSTPEAGAMEYDGTNLYFTPSTTRKIVMTGLTTTVSLNFPNINANNTSELNVTVTGAAVGDSCSCAPNSFIEPNLQWSCYVSAAGNVKVRLSNVGLGSINPATRSWKVSVIQ